jgi:hypothetical protein
LNCIATVETSKTIAAAATHVEPSITESQQPATKVPAHDDAHVLSLTAKDISASNTSVTTTESDEDDTECSTDEQEVSTDSVDEVSASTKETEPVSAKPTEKVAQEKETKTTTTVDLQAEVTATTATPTPKASTKTEAVTPVKEVLNEVRAVISGPTETVLILTQDIRPWLDGTPRTLRDLVVEQLILFDAESLKIQPTEEEVDRVVLQIQKNNNYTHEKILEMLSAIDYTMEEFRADLRRKHAVDTMLDYRVRNDKRMAVSEEEVKTWWDAHAENQFKLMVGHVTTKLSKDDVEKAITKGSLTDPIDWEKPFSIAEAQLPEEKQFIKERKAGEIVLVEPEENGFEITKLISQGKEPLKSGNKEHDQQRYKEIERKLQMDRYNVVREEYEQKLLKNARIEFKHEADRLAIMGK